MAARFSGVGRPYAGLAAFKIIGEGTPAERVEAHWTGEVRLIEKHLLDPLKWEKPSRIFVNSMSDLFHPGVKDEWLAEIFDVMARAPQHKYIVLTKRPERMREALRAAGNSSVSATFERLYGQQWPPTNWWFGVSVEDQATADHRVPILLQCPASIRFISYEPALGPVNFAKAAGDPAAFMGIDWLIVGGESGHSARPMHPQWARDARDLCSTTGVKFFFKQWGEWGLTGPLTNRQSAISREGNIVSPITGANFVLLEGEGSGWQTMYNVGKHDSGSKLDGVEWKEFPQC